MSYRIRFTLPDGRTGLWNHNYPTREEAQRAIDDCLSDTGFAYTVEVTDAAPAPEPTSTTERIVGLLRDRHARGLAKYGTTLDRTDLSPEDWAQHAIEEALDLAGYLMRFKDGFAPEPGSMAAHHFEILRTRVNVLEALVEARGKAVTDAHVANHAMHRDLLFALEIGQAMREAMRTGEWRAGHDRSMANSAVAGWDRFKPSLAKAPSVPEAPGEGGDSDRRRLEALERWVKKGDAYKVARVASRGTIVAWPDSTIEEGVEAPTLLALADKLAEKEDRP